MTEQLCATNVTTKGGDMYCEVCKTWVTKRVVMINEKEEKVKLCNMCVLKLRIFDLVKCECCGQYQFIKRKKKGGV